MKICDFKTNPDNTLSNVECKKKISNINISGEGRIEIDIDKSFRFVSKDSTFQFDVCDEKDASLIIDYINRHYYNLASIKQDGQNSGVFFMHISFFYSMKRLGKFDITITDEIVQKLIDKKVVNKNSDIYSQIEKNFMLTDGVNACFAYTAGNYYSLEDKDVEKNEEIVGGEINDGETSEVISDASDKLVENKAKDNKTLKIYGQDYSFQIAYSSNEFSEMLIVEKVDFSKRKVPSMAIAIGELKVSNHAQYVSSKVKKILSESPGYLDLWNKYAELEGEFLLKRAREVGLITIDREHVNIHGDNLLVYLKGDVSKLKKHLSNGDYLCFSEEIPLYLQDEEMTWGEYRECSTILKSKNVKIIEFNHNGSMVIDTDDIANSPYISLSIHGDELQIVRREEARKMIANGESANPGLGLIIEGSLPDGMMINKQERKVEPLSDFVRNKIFKNEPTPTQREAINIALNTPDIAIIQGPPGTGKTTVITAILERLNELADKRKINNGQVLITSFQHDAVRNVIERLSINSLPTIKYGTRLDDEMTTDEAVEKWCQEIIKKLSERNPSMRSSEEQQELFRLHNFYVLSPCNQNALTFLKYAKLVNHDNGINEDIDAIIDELSANDDVENGTLLRSIRRIRTTEAGFKDDGPENADVVLEQIELIIDRSNSDNKKIVDVLEKAALSSKTSVSEELLIELKMAKEILLEKCVPKPSYALEVPREDIAEIYSKVKKLAQKPETKEDEILYALYYELSNNTISITNAVSAYNFVFASTTQQSEGNDIKKAKGIGRKEHPKYNTVVVDEAARVNPGDLMIPLAQAERRIILVGDHRQLPHIYDEEIFEALQENGGLKNEQDVGITLFQHLMNNAKKLYEKDGIPRTITLDAQYRMHPLLGNFISDNFYKQHGESFKSPLPDTHFKQGLYHKPLKWVNLTNDFGPEEKYGTSRIRTCEAEYIANEIRRCMSTEEGKNLSYGVISFYSAQVKKIQNQLGDLQDKVRVGSVDAFQGMEFDIIFLSVVRTHSALPKELNMEWFTNDYSDGKIMSDEQEKYIQKIGQSTYGFLVSENRLCVSLSRQKKLLVVVGDGNIFHGEHWGDISKKCVPAMYNLYKLCSEEGVVENG